MSHHVRNLATYLFVVATIALSTATNAAQEAESPAKTPSESEKQPLTAEKPPFTESSNKVEGIVSEWSAWAKEPAYGTFNDYVPAKTVPFPTAEEAKAHLDSAIESTFADHLNRKLGNSRLAYRLTPSSTILKTKFAGDNLWEVLKSEEGGVTKYRAATRLDIPHSEVESLISDYHHKRLQLSAVQKTAFVGGGLIAFIGILAFQAKLNHATNGKRTGILRAASAIAILFLLGGFITAAALTGIFSA